MAMKSVPDPIFSMNFGRSERSVPSLPRSPLRFQLGSEDGYNLMKRMKSSRALLLSFLFFIFFSPHFFLFLNPPSSDIKRVFALRSVRGIFLLPTGQSPRSRVGKQSNEQRKENNCTAARRLQAWMNRSSKFNCTNGRANYRRRDLIRKVCPRRQLEMQINKNK